MVTKRRKSIRMSILGISLIVFGLLSLLPLFSLGQRPLHEFKIGKSDFKLDGKPFEIRCGELHLARIPEASWRARLKMVKAMGLNTVCAYLFWNMHERVPGVFTWTGRSDAAKFCRIAQQEGLYVILRPGPYSCAEWDFGGFPWWLLKNKHLQLRNMNHFYLKHSHAYLMEVGKQLAPLQITRGGNIIMVQVENEYGSYGNDTIYMKTLKGYLQQAGFDVPLFHCDGSVQLKNDNLKDLFAVVNFGSDPAGNFKILREVQPTGPLMCGEYYPGWFDSWGRPHHYGDNKRILSELKYMLDQKESFSIYMVDGGTSFGTYSGANEPPYLPQTSSYDYDAPINEAGNPTEKYYELRNLFSKYLQPGETLPSVPDTVRIQVPTPVHFTAFASLSANLPKPILSDTPMHMEDLNQGFGAVLYTTYLTPGNSDSLRFDGIHDYALVYLDNQLIGTIDRREYGTQASLALPMRQNKMKLSVLVEALGRVNYGQHMIDYKGIIGSVAYIGKERQKSHKLLNWQNYPIPMGDINLPVHYKRLHENNQLQLQNLKENHFQQTGYFKGEFTVNARQSCYLDMSNWNMGLVWINGKCLGRFWNIGPTQSMLVPGDWLKKGKNEIVIFDYLGQTKLELKFVDHPILDEIKPGPMKSHRKQGQIWIAQKAGGLKPYYSGQFLNNPDWQSVSFPKVDARYFCLEGLSEQTRQPFCSAAEIVLLDQNGREIPRANWKVVYADSEELNGADGNAANVFDLQFTSIWHTSWQNSTSDYPHQIVIDLGGNYEVTGMKLLPRQDSPNGRIKDYNLYFSISNFKGM